ncbi:MAG: hypothetical protein MUE41_06430 [Gemmatimonadaceae bacterium]|jgi:hypothetical protein|nr:hypothetical protein [Gemmatimonadaceae bacterium]
MTAERRFDDTEVAQILAAASVESARGIAEPHPTERALTAASGMTLAEVQAVAAEAGIAPELIARAARRVARGELQPTERRTVAGLPVAVARTLDFGRPISDLEWDRIVVALRETFDARGVVSRDGSIREWRNGNLRAVLERTAAGDRLRIATRRGDAGFFPRIGVAMVGLSITLGALGPMVGSGDPRSIVPVVVLGAMGIAALVRNVLVLPAWARQRTRQMESLGPAIDQVIAEPRG